MGTARATRMKLAAPTMLRPVAGAFTTRPRTRCAACGREVGLLEARHLVDGAPFHTVCVPGR
jgi:hypothetical protein